MELSDYKKFIGSWLFFSITTAISILSLLKNFGAVGLNGWLEGFIDLYIRLASALHYLNAIININLTKMDSLIIVSWSFIFIPAFFAIYKHLETEKGKVYLAIGIVIYILFIFNGVSGNSHGGSWRTGVIGNLIGVSFFALITVCLSTRGGSNRLSSLIYFSKNLIGASVICWLLIFSGLANLI